MTINREPTDPIEQGKEYKKVVEEIKELNWEKLNPKELQDLMYLSYVAAREFAEALRIALKLYPENSSLREMSEGELGTTNLKQGDYEGPGDHADFLQHFLEKYKIKPNEMLVSAADKYLDACRNLSDQTRAMSIFSREEELSGIFEKILKAKDWTTAGLPEFKYYLSEHIRLDAGEGGHHDMTKDFTVDDSVKPFYQHRLEMYRAIPKLFENRNLP